MSVVLAARPGLLGAPGFVRLWVAGGIGSAMLWLEVLAAALFTLSVTGSSLDVAIVSAARAAPLLVVGVLLGAVSDAMDRRRIVMVGFLLAAATSGSIATLAAFGLVRPWHLIVSALVGGVVYGTELPARRRLIAECAGVANMRRATAADILTGSATRVAGPLLGGWAYGQVGLFGAFALSATLSLVAAVLVGGVVSRQEVRPLVLRDIGPEIAAGWAFARRQRAVLLLLGMTVTMNLCGYSYSALVAPLGKLVFRQGPAMIGVLAAAEPAGSLAAGLAIALWPLRGPSLRWLIGGASMLLLALAAVSWLGEAGGSFWPVCGVLFMGGTGVAAYAVTQTTIVLDATPPPLRSRVMGLVSMAIGCWPLGILLGGALTTGLGLLGALRALALLGLTLVGGLLLLARRR